MFQTFTFPVEANRPIDKLILNSRAAMADVITDYVNEATAGANSAGIDQATIGQRISLTWMAAHRASRLLRAIPPTLVSWVFRSYADAQNTEVQYPRPFPGMIGIHGPRWLTQLAGDVVVIEAGGVKLVGTAPQAFDLHRVYEVRVIVPRGERTGIQAQIVLSSDQGPRANADQPMDPALEPEDA